MNVNVHFSFNGDCRQAFEFYAKVLGGKVAAMMPYAGTPAEQYAPGGNTELIMHAFMEVANTSFMGADSGDRYEEMAGAHVSLNYDDVDQARQVFNALSDGGTVQMPFEKTFWAKGFGMVRDRFGTQWMVNVSEEMPEG